MTAITWVQERFQNGTLSALRHRNFRLYFTGQTISVSGTWMQAVAQGWLVFHLTHDTLWLGIVACAAGLPSVILSPVAGVVIDRIPRRRILVMTQTAQMLLAFTLSALTFTGVVQVWHVVALAFALGITNSIDAPARQTFITDMVGSSDRFSGIALHSMVMNGARVVGPAIAGITLDRFGPGWCFLLNGMSFLAVIAMLMIMDVHPVMMPKQTSSPLAQLKEGLRFARSHPTIGPLLLVAMATGLTTMNAPTLLPAFASTVLDSPVQGYAAMNTAQGVGAIGAALVVAWAVRRYGRGRVVTAMTACMMLAILTLALVTEVNPAVALMGAYGVFLMLLFITLNTTIQSEVPDEFRGRVMSLYTLTVWGLSTFGALGLGLLATRIGISSALTVYALAGGLTGAAIMLRAPRARNLR